MSNMSVEQTCIVMGDPLDIGEEPIRYLSDRFVNGRVEHQCAYCMGVIQNGERHRVIRAVVDGDMGSVRYCMACCVAQAETARNESGAVDKWVARLGMFGKDGGERRGG